jgi:ankyrin repeat protein
LFVLFWRPNSLFDLGLPNSQEPRRVISTLLSSNKDLARLKDGFGNTALHLALEAGMSAEIIASLLQACPEAANWQNDHGKFPLHLIAAITDKDKHPVLTRLAALSPLHNSPI